MTRSATSLTELARQTGVARPTLSRWLNRHSDAGDESLERVAEALRVALPLATVGSERVMRVAESVHVGDEYPRSEGGAGDGEVTLPTHRAGAGTQLPDDEVLQLMLYDRPGFVRYLQQSWAEPVVNAAAKLGRLDFLEELARERRIPVPKAYLDHLRGLVRERGL